MKAIKQFFATDQKSDLAPYYHWKDVEAYYRHKLANFRNSKM